MALTLIRHLAPPEGAGLCYGRSDLTASGVLPDAARRLAGFRPVDRIVTSPLIRCRILAVRLGRTLGLPVRIDPDWREMDFGRWEGLPWDHVPRAELDAWAADLVHARPHGGESVAQLLARTRRALSRWHGGGHTLVVTHAGVIRAALVAAGAGVAAWQRPIGFGEAVTLAPPARRRR